MKPDSFSVTGKRKIKDKINRKRKKSHPADILDFKKH